MDNNLKEAIFPLEESSDLIVERVSFSWSSGVKALDQCSFSVPCPGLWMLVGTNGSGKSTLFRLLRGMIKPQSGVVHCKLKSALMLQNPDHQLLLPTCYSDLVLSLPVGLSKVEKGLRIKNLLDQVGMPGMDKRPIHTLSGGQKQRLSLAGALASDANLFLLDEPTALLDPSSQQSILKLVKNLCNRKENPITALWITHRLEELQSCTGAALMKNGRISEWFAGEELFHRLN